MWCGVVCQSGEPEVPMKREEEQKNCVVPGRKKVKGGRNAVSAAVCIP